MPRRPALITQADVARAIRAAKKEGATAVELRPDGCIVVQLAPSCTQAEGSSNLPIADDKGIVL
jgi:hypothetical protein